MGLVLSTPQPTHTHSTSSGLYRRQVEGPAQALGARLKLEHLQADTLGFESQFLQFLAA